MKIVPRYDGPPIVTLAADARGGGAGVGDAFLRQRRRLLAIFEALSDDDWRAPTRCEGWTVQDVATHLEGVNRFWHLSIASGLAGEPTRYLADFDPKATPAAMVDAVGSPPPAETLASLTESSEALCDAVAELDPEQWSAIAEAPAGHLPIRLLVHHALWDCWVHERDVALPLGLPLAEEADEVMACLRFSAALGPAFAVDQGLSTPAALVLETTDPDGCVVVEVTDRVAVSDRSGPDHPADGATVVVRDTAVNLVEALSARAPLAYDVPDEHRWLLATLGTVFESA
jgi:uncharacterized protein (TIGR03083 family)